MIPAAVEYVSPVLEEEKQQLSQSTSYRNTIARVDSASSINWAQTLPTFTFKPAACGSSLADLIDLNEIFADDFFPPDLDYSSLGLPLDVPSDDRSGQYPPSFSFFQRPPPVMDRKHFPQSEYIVRNKDNLILIPPAVPKNDIFVPGGTTQEGMIKLERDDRDEDDITEDEDMQQENNVSGGRSRRISRKRAMGDEEDDNQLRGAMSARGASASRVSALEIKDLAEYQRVERRERNREHAKRSRVRKKLLLDSLQDQLMGLRRENMALRRVVSERIPQAAAKILTECTTEESSLLAHINSDSEGDSENGKKSSELNKSLGNSSMYKPSPLTANIASKILASSAMANGPSSSSAVAHPVSRPKQSARILMEPDYRLIHSLVHSQQNFVLSDPSLPDNPIVYASEGFCRMTGYKRQDVLGRNCRFLQGPGTDQAAVDIIRQGIAEGHDISVCLLNYKADGKPFWNQFFLAALKDAEGHVVNYVGVQCEVNNIPVLEIKDRVKKLPIPTDL
eukprot:gene3143-3442_t